MVFIFIAATSSVLQRADDDLNETTKLTNSIDPESKFQTCKSDFGCRINKGNRNKDFLDLEVIPSYHSSCSNA